MTIFPPSDIPNVKTYESAASLIPFSTTPTAYQDLTGRFPHKSSRGNEYLLVVYDFDSNAILVEPLKSRRGGEIKNAWPKIYNILASSGCAPKQYILDNEMSHDLKAGMTKHKLKYQCT